MKRAILILIILSIFSISKSSSQTKEFTSSQKEFVITSIDTTFTYERIETLGTIANVKTYLTLGADENGQKVIRFCFNENCDKSPIFMTYQSFVISADQSKHYRSSIITNGNVQKGYVKIWNDRATISIFFPNGNKHVLKLFEK